MKRKGVSLIILVITIIVMSILAGVVIYSMEKTNHIEKANSSVLITDLKAAQMELDTNLSVMQIHNKDIYFNYVNVTGKEVLNYIPSLKKEFIGKVEIVNGEFYVCPCYNQIIDVGHKKIRNYNVFEAMWGLGTPEDLCKFLVTELSRKI